MSIRVEFYGIPRERAGVPAVDLEAACLRDAFQAICAQFPELARSCFTDGRLQPGYLANINGVKFTSDPDAILQAGDSLLILSADVGG